MRMKITTTNAPAALGPYPQAILAGDHIYISGQLGIDPATGEFAGDTAALQARQAFANIDAILNQAGCSMNNIVKTTCFLSNMDDFAAVNEVYEEFLEEPYPARSAFEVAKLPKGGLVEIETIAIIK